MRSHTIAHFLSIFGTIGRTLTKCFSEVEDGQICEVGDSSYSLQHKESGKVAVVALSMFEEKACIQ